MSKGKIFVISGASGVGKSSVLKEVMAARDDLVFSVSVTTRAPRQGEIPGVSYDYITDAQFQEMLAADAFLEYDIHHAASYGTPLAQLEEKLSRANVLLDIEPNGAFTVKKKRPEATLIFITPPSMEELERRLRDRKDTSEEQVRIRMERAVWEMEQRAGYDYVVENRRVDQCAREILQIIANAADEK